MTLTLDSLQELLRAEGINSKELVIKAFKKASSTDLIGFRNDLNKHIAIKIMKERKEERK